MVYSSPFFTTILSSHRNSFGFTMLAPLFYLELTLAVVLHSEEENRAGQTAVGVVTGQEGGHLATDHPHSHLQNISVAYR